MKKKVEYDDYALKPFEVDDFKKKEAMILEAIRKGQLPTEMISGEIKVQFN